MYDILTTCAGNGTCACVGVKVMYKEENRNLGNIFQIHYGLIYLEYLNLYQNGVVKYIVQEYRTFYYFQS